MFQLGEIVKRSDDATFMVIMYVGPVWAVLAPITMNEGVVADPVINGPGEAAIRVTQLEDGSFAQTGLYTLL